MSFFVARCVRVAVLSIATKMVSAPPVHGILQGGQQVSSTILMYNAKRGRGAILVAIESTSARLSCLERTLLKQWFVFANCSCEFPMPLSCELTTVRNN